VNRFSILQETKQCYVCGNKIVHIHEVYFGKNRSKSIQDGCCVYLCATHHNMSNQGVHFNKQLDLQLKQSMERKWLEVYNKTIEDFIQRYGKNYI